MTSKNQHFSFSPPVLMELKYINESFSFSEGYYLILFADLIGSTEVASEQSPDAYAKTYIASFRWAANRAIDFLKLDVWENNKDLNFKHKISEISIIGDEVISITKLESTSSRDNRARKEVDDLNSDIVASAILFAYLIKLYWFVSPYNLNRLKSKQFTRDISVGLHIGPAGRIIEDNDGEADGNDALNIAGLHINIAKRIETLARLGTSTRIFASEDVNHLFNHWTSRFRERTFKSQAPLRFLKFDRFGDRHFIQGLPRSIEVFELCWDTSSNDFLLMLKEFTSFTFDTNDIEAENVLQRLGKAFFRLQDANTSPSTPRYLAKAVDFDSLNNSTGVKTNYTQDDAMQDAKAYIEYWFNAVESPPKVFLDELFISTSYFIISCALYRCYCEISKDISKLKHGNHGGNSSYQEIVEKMFLIARKFIEAG